MKPAILSHDAYLRAVTLRDLTDPAQGQHAMQQLVDRILHALRTRCGCEVRVHRAHPAVPVEHDYDRLHYPPGGAARDARYTRCVSETTVLRTQTAAMVGLRRGVRSGVGRDGEVFTRRSPSRATDGLVHLPPGPEVAKR